MRKSEKAFIVAELRQKYPLKELLALSVFAGSTLYYYVSESKKVDKYAEKRSNSEDI